MLGLHWSIGSYQSLIELISDNQDYDRYSPYERVSISYRVNFWLGELTGLLVAIPLYQSLIELISDLNGLFFEVETGLSINLL